MNKKFIDIVNSWKTVFSYQDLAYFFWNDKKKLAHKVSYYAEKWYLYKIKKWLYSLDKNYNRLELATKILKPSYISLETALKIHGIIFQYTSAIYVISYKSYETEVDSENIVFKFLNKKIRENYDWIENKKNYSIAWLERAVLDTLYLYKDFYFDNLRPVSWDKIEQLLPIYNSKSLEKRVNILKSNFIKNDNKIG